MECENWPVKWVDPLYVFKYYTEYIDKRPKCLTKEEIFIDNKDVFSIQWQQGQQQQCKYTEKRPLGQKIQSFHFHGAPYQWSYPILFILPKT